mmetsp:Transcript_108988/g.347968  ORF Transcript_108988/g.347968 Transcript_108988/m.347968 type:complete len:535 (-) Transcript_108988:116-1720(-)
MQLLLESDGVYSSLCSPSNPSCGDRVSRLVLLYTVGSTGNVIGGAPCGFLVDHLGPQRCSLLSGLLVTAGLLLMGISEEDGFDAFLVGSFLIGFGGSFVMMCSIPAAFVLPETRRTLYLSATNCLFDASSVVFLLIFMLYEHLNLSRRAIMVGFAITCALLHIVLFMAWNMGPSAALRAEKAAELGGEGGAETAQQGEAPGFDAACCKEAAADDAGAPVEGPRGAVNEAPWHQNVAVVGPTEPKMRGFAMFCDLLPLALFPCWAPRRGPSPPARPLRARSRRAPLGEAPAPEVMGAREAVAEGAQRAADVKTSGPEIAVEEVATPRQRPALHGLPLRRQLMTFEFAFSISFLCTQLFRSSVYLVTNKELLQDLGDASTGYVYTQIFAASLAASAVVFPVINMCLERRGFADTFMLIVGLGMVWNAVALVPNLPFQLMGFAAFTIFRAFLYCAHFVFLTHTFGSRTSGRIQGTISLLAACVNFMIWPSIMVVNDLVNRFTYLYGFLMLVSIPPGVMVLLLRRRLSNTPLADCRRV